MKEYMLLLLIGLLWTIVATYQDIKKREVANWLNFSLIAFALSYRAFYSINNNPRFFILGFLGFLIFVVLANIFYYSRVFAGGDAKLLMAFGVLLPYDSYQSLIYTSLTFLIILFLLGSIYTLIYTVYLLIKNKNKFKKEFSRDIKKNKSIFLCSLIVSLGSLIISFYNVLFLVILMLSLIPLLYFYAKSLDKCMVKLKSPKELTEGDWLEQNIKISKSRYINKTVHGLSLKDIELLKKYKKNVLIKEGIPFVPSFLLTIIVMVFFALASKHFPSWLVALFPF